MGKYRMTEPWGFMEENEYVSREIQNEELNEKLISKVEYDPLTSKMKFYNLEDDVLYEFTVQGGGGGDAIWGAIGGNIDDQADLNDEFVRKSMFLNTLFPTGCLYLMYDKVNPATFIGGEWELIEEGYYPVTTVKNAIDSQDERFLAAKLPKMTGNFTITGGGSARFWGSANGVFKEHDPSSGHYFSSEGSDSGLIDGYVFDSSAEDGSIYTGEKTEVQPKSVLVYIYRRVDSGQLVYNFAKLGFAANDFIVDQTTGQVSLRNGIYHYTDEQIPVADEQGKLVDSGNKFLKSTANVRTYADSEDTKIPTEKFLQKTLHNIELPEQDKDAANKKYVDDMIAELSGKVLKFKGFISPTAPTGSIEDGSLWYESNILPSTFPINVKTYNATTNQWSSTTSQYTPQVLDLWANLSNDNGYYWFGNSWNLIDDNTTTDNKTIQKNINKELELKDGDNINGVTFAKLNTNLYHDTVADEDDRLPLNSAVYKELLDKDNSKFEYDDTDTEKDLLKLKLKNKNGDTIYEEEIDFEDKIVFEEKEQTLTNKTIDADDNTIKDLTGKNVKDTYMVHEIKASDTYYGFTFDDGSETTNVFTKTTAAGQTSVFSINNLTKEITLLGEGTIARNSLTYDNITYLRNETLDDYYIDKSDVKFSSVDMAIYLKKLIDEGKITFKQVSTFDGEEGDSDVLYYLNTANEDYNKGFYLYNGTTFDSIDQKSVQFVHTFTGVDGNTDVLYYLDTAYGDYVKGFYRYIETTTEGVTIGEFVLIGHNQVVYLSTFDGVTGNAEKLYYLDTAYEGYKVGFYRFIEAQGTTPAKFVQINIVELSESISYSALKTLRDSEELVPGKWYRITDYITTTTQADIRSAGHQFDIIVQAQDVNVLSETAYATLHEGDTYFANSDLSAWELKYCLDNDTTRFSWADPNGKGVVFRMKDEFENEWSYDFKNIQFKRWKVADSMPNRTYLNNLYMGVNGALPVYLSIPNTSDFIWAFTFSSSADGGEQTDMSLSRSNNNFANVYKGDNFVNNVHYGVAHVNNVYGADCTNNTFNERCYGNTFGYRCTMNSFGPRCFYVTLGNLCERNSFGKAKSITFGNNCISNALGDNLDVVTMGGICKDNTLLNNVKEVVFHHVVVKCFIGNNCASIVIKGGGDQIQIGDLCMAITIDVNCTHINILGGAQTRIVQNATVLTSTSGTSASPRVIEFAPNKNYLQVAGMTSDGQLRIWNPADLAEPAATIIDVVSLPTEDIDTDAIYRLTTVHYYHNGTELAAEPQGYKSLDEESVVADENGLTVTSSSTVTPWAEVTDAFLQTLIDGSLVNTCDYADASFYKLDTDSYDFSGNFSTADTYSLWHNATGDPADWEEFSSVANLVTDGNTTEEVNGELQANAIISVDALPTTNIKEKSLYEMTETVSWEEHHYTHNTDPVVEIKSYKLTPTGGQVLEITENDGIWFAQTQTWTPWSELTESTIDYFVDINRLMECDFDDADKQFSGYKENAESAWGYDYKTKVSDSPTTETFSMTKLFRRRNNQWQSVSTIKLTAEQYARLTNAQKTDGTIYILDVDSSVAIIDVTELPVTDIETQSFYRINEHVHKEEWHYYHNDVELNEPPLLYRSTSPNFVVSETKVTVNGVDYQYSDINSTLVESWLGTYIETVPEFSNAQFCCYDVEYFDYAGNFTFEHPIVDFNMLKLFSRYNDTWKSHSTIKLTEEQYDALTTAQKNDTTVYIVGSNAEVLVDEVTAEFVDDKLQANAVIPVDSLPTTDIKDKSLYEITETVTISHETYTYDGNPIAVTPKSYKSISPNATVGNLSLDIYMPEWGTTTPYYYKITPGNYWVNPELVEGWISEGLIEEVEFANNDSTAFCHYGDENFDNGSHFEKEGSSETHTITKLFRRRNDAWVSVSTIKVTEELYEHLTETQKTDGTIYIIEEETSAILDVDTLPTTNILKDIIYRLNIKECRRKPTGDVIENAVAYRSKNLEECSYNTDGMSFRQLGEEPIFYPWDNVDDTIISDLISGGYIEETSLEQGDFFKAASNFYLYKTSVEFVSYYELYHNPTATADAFIKVGGGDVDVDNQTIVEVENQLRANAIIDIETLPTTNILKNSIYRKYGEAYMYKGSEIAQPTGYTSADPERVVITATGIDHMEEGTLLNHYDWENVTDSVILTVGNLAPATFEEAEMFKIGDNQYDYKTTVTHEQVCELYHNPTGLQNDYKLIGGGGSAEVDEVTTELISDKVQANAIIPVTSLPTTNIKEKSLYQYTENVGYVLDHWTRGDEEIETPQHFYKSVNYYLQVYNGEILYYHEEAGDPDWPYVNNHVEWYRFTDEHLEYFLNKNLIVECTPTDGTFCEYAAGKYDWVNDGTSATMGVKHTSETKNFSMTKLFRRVNGAWESISVIGLTEEQYDNLPTSIKNDGTLYIVDDAAELVVEKTYKALADKPVVNGITLNGSLTLEDLGLYSRTEVNALLENKGAIEFVSQLPATPTTNTWYYSTKFEDGTTVPNDKRALYIVDEDITQYHYMGIVGDIEMETGDTLSGSEHLVTSSQVVKKEMSTKLNKYGTQVDIETAVNDATLWTTLAQIGTDDKKTDSSMVFNAGTCYLIHTVSPTNTAQIFQFIVTGSVGASAINKKITLINPTTNEVFTKAMDGGTWQAWKGGKKYKHTLVRYNNDSFEYPMGWASVISNKKTMSVDDFKTWLNDKGYTTATNSYYWCGGCCGTTEVRNGAGTGKAYVGRVASGIFYDGTNLFFKWDYNGTTQINPARCKIITDELN